MKHKRLSALVLAAAFVLAGCSGIKGSSGSAAAEQSPGSARNAPAEAAQPESSRTDAAREKSVLPGSAPAETASVCWELPPDWEQQMLAEWMAVSVVSDGKAYSPADRNESYTLRLEKANTPGMVTAAFTQEKYLSPQIQSTAETRTGTLNAGTLTRWDGEKSQNWSLRCQKQDEYAVWNIAMQADGSLLMHATGRKKGSEVWYILQRTEAWDDIGYTAIPRKLWGTFGTENRSSRGIYWMTFLPDGRCCMSVEWNEWNGFLTGTATGTQSRTEDGTELYFTLTDKNSRPCEFWAVLLNDDGSPGGYSLKYRAGEQLFDRAQRQHFWKQSAPYLTIVP